MAVHQPDLFGAAAFSEAHRGARPSGFREQADFLRLDEEAELISRIDGAGLEPFQFQQWQGKRLTASFGWNYDFTAGKLGLAPAIPEWLLPIRERAARFAGLSADDLVQALLIRYDPGAGIGWHKDRPIFEHVVGISLGNGATMRFRQRQEDGFARANTKLVPRSIYHLEGEIRHRWEHSIAPLDAPRWSITFRSLSTANGRRGSLT